jgi:hypothetical protein
MTAKVHLKEDIYDILWYLEKSFQHTKKINTLDYHKVRLDKEIKPLPIYI